MLSFTSVSVFFCDGLVIDYAYKAWIIMKWLSFTFIVLNIVNYFITPKGIKNIGMVYTPFPILNGLEIIIPKPSTWLDSPCLQFHRLSKIYGDVFQIKFGNKLIVVANSHAAIRQLWCTKNVKGNNSRPVSYSFHKVLSKGGIYTIGSTIMGKTYRNSRKHVSEHVLSEKRNKEFNHIIIEKSCNEFINSLIKNSTKKEGRIIVANDMLLEAQYFHLKIALWLTYGFDLNLNDLIHQSLANEIISVENRITKVRSHIQNVQDYLPIWLRVIYNCFSNNNLEFVRLYESRQKYLQIFYSFAKQNYDDICKRKVYAEVKKESLSSINKIEDLKNTLMYNYFEESDSKVNFEEVTSECLTMVSAGLDNTPLNFKYGLHMLCNYYPSLWDKAFRDLLQIYDNDLEKAYKECSRNMNSNFVHAIVEETLRLFTVLPLALPRETTANVIYKDAVIPPKTTLFMNCWAGNHDEKVFPQPLKFFPERWLKTTVNQENIEIVEFNASIKHFAFGIGCRKCLGNNFAKRELYVLFAKLILKFKPLPTEGERPPANPLELNMYPESLAIEPLPFNIRLEVRTSY